MSPAGTLTFAVDASTNVTGKGVGTKTRGMKAEGAAEVKIHVKSFKKQ